MLSDDNEYVLEHNLENEMLYAIKEGDNTVKFLNEKIDRLEDKNSRLEEGIARIEKSSTEK